MTTSQRRITKMRFGHGGLNPKWLREHGLSGGLHTVPCPGDAHSNPYIDNCGICAPNWEEVEVPIEHASLDAWRDWLSGDHQGSSP